MAILTGEQENVRHPFKVSPRGPWCRMCGLGEGSPKHAAEQRHAYKCRICGAAMEANFFQVLLRRMEHHIANHVASGWESP